MISVAAVDVGSLPKTGWWHRNANGNGSGGRDVDDLCAALVEELDAGELVALGFEAPLWIPFVTDRDRLGKGRPGEGSRPWSAGAGTGVTVYGLQQSTYVYERIARNVANRPSVTFDPARLAAGDAQLLIWEAFVSGKAKERDALEPHVSDARAAVNTFVERWLTGHLHSDIDDIPAISLAGLALHAAGLSNDAALLHERAVVVRAPDL